MSSNPVLYPGDKNKSVIKAKKLAVATLKKMGRDKLASSIDVTSKKYGINLEAGIKAIQRRHKLKIDGIVGPNTWKVLEYARKSKPPIPVLVIIPRNEWGANPPKGVNTTQWSSTTPTRVHHTDTQAPTGSGADLINAEKEAIKKIQEFHMNTRKYNDIAYNFLITPSGRVYEGRGKNVVGAHTLGHNEDCGVAFVGNYEKDKLTKAQILAYKLLRAKLGVSKGNQYPHKATYSTACPGKNIIDQLGL